MLPIMPGPISLYWFFLRRITIFGVLFCFVFGFFFFEVWKYSSCFFWVFVCLFWFISLISFSVCQNLIQKNTTHLFYLFSSLCSVNQISSMSFLYHSCLSDICLCSLLFFPFDPVTPLYYLIQLLNLHKCFLQ